ncbi:MAG: DUF2332 domain-containing protein [Nocardioidaceae bacterium]|nr:DUF2332 domain-containing protein [Nocardioidaceae bacterium]
MADFDTEGTLADRMRKHASDEQHLYGHLMRAMADDWDARGPVRDICRGWENAPQGAVVQLRLLGGLFRLVLTDRAPDLVPFYPSLGGNEPPAKAWPHVRRVLGEHVQELRRTLDVAPQTNETGRSTALLVGLFDVVRRSGLSKVRLLEPGASAGLNLLVDQFRFESPTWAYGPGDSALRLVDAVIGPVTATPFEIVERRGCDLAPVDATTPEGQLTLRSFVWPFHVERHERLTQALDIARRHPVTVDRAGAGEWLEERLSAPAADDVVTVVWQSITQQYWPLDETARVDAVVARAARSQRVARVAMEFHERATAELTVDLAAADGSGLDGPIRLGDVGDHGTPVTLS